jgi:hypothetical protein
MVARTGQEIWRNVKQTGLASFVAETQDRRVTRAYGPAGPCTLERAIVGMLAEAARSHWTQAGGYSGTLAPPHDRAFLADWRTWHGYACHYGAP